MFIYLCIATDGSVVNVTRSVAGAAHFAAAYANRPFVTGDDLTIEALTLALTANASVTITYIGADLLTVQRHALLI